MRGRTKVKGLCPRTMALQAAATLAVQHGNPEVREAALKLLVSMLRGDAHPPPQVMHVVYRQLRNAQRRGVTDAPAR